ncbi:MAG TPA: hypothetical protein VJ767_07590 [Nitrososphaeraceae archaeon]|nr:hypothetical protein [Nitrososphaeraceae archaeon]
MLNTNLIYLRLEGTLSNLVIFYHFELLTIRRIAIDVQVQRKISVVVISLHKKPNDNLIIQDYMGKFRKLEF